MSVLFAILLALVIIGGGVSIYNRLVKDRNQVENAWSDIDVQLKRRHDLVPQLVEAVKAYAGYEKATLTAVTALRMRAINGYGLDGEDFTIRAAGHTVFDFATARRITRNVDFNFAVDNVLDRKYYEMQNYFESRLPGQEPLERIHGTPGYGRTLVVGVTLRFGGK